MQVVYGVASGMSNNQIGSLLDVTGKTIKSHLVTIAWFLELDHSRRELIVAECFRRGYLAWVDDKMVVCDGFEEDDRARKQEAHSSPVGEHDTELPRSGTSECDRATA
jgi:DNA-binding CsgD family transcriptional regulator